MCEMDVVFRALADRRRRCALRHLQRHSTMRLPDLAELVVEHEADLPASELSGERVMNVYMSLYHNHIPVLEEAGLVRYEQEADTVAGTGRTEQLLREAEATVESLLRTS